MYIFAVRISWYESVVVLLRFAFGEETNKLAYTTFKMPAVFA